MVTVLAGGWSARDHLDNLEGYVIGVNDAALLAPCHAAVSMDRLWTEHRWTQLSVRMGVEAWIRKAALKNVGRRPAWLTPFDCDHASTEFAEQAGVLNGTHSGFCALNLAYQLRPARVILVGFDMGKGPQGQAHWYPDYPWAKPGGGTGAGRFAEWAGQFEGAAARFKAAGIAVEVRGATAIPAFRELA